MPEPRLKDKRWEISKEQELFQKWQKEGLYSKPTIKGRVFIIDTPPPYPSGRWHMGGATHYSQIDMLARYFRMSKRSLWFPMGIDRNGLPIESRVEKDYGVNAHEIERERFLQLCNQKLDEYEENIMNVTALMGLSVDLANVYRTDSPEYRSLTQATFIDLWNKGLIYEATKPNNWCPGCKTTLADAEVEYKVEKSDLVHISFPLKEGGSITIATSRPELLFACQAVIVHPDDARYKKLHGKVVVLPLVGREVNIHPRQEAKPDFGTGAMMVCSYGDVNDVRLFREMKLEEIILVGPEGKLTERAGKYSGQKVKQARKNIVADLQQAGAVNKLEPVEHNVPICWRSKDEIELIALPEFYLKQSEFVEKIRKLSKKIKFHPESMRQLLEDWFGSVSQDWPISRRRFYGTPVPIFYCPQHGAWVPEPERYYDSWNEVLPCPKCGKKSEGDRRVLDTWMDSSISALAVSGYGTNNKLFTEGFPVFLRPQGKDIVRTWLFYSLLRIYQLTGKMAFENVWVSGHVVDANGVKMSKSVGNVVYPEPLVEKYGADAVRLQGATEAKAGSDIRTSEERIIGAGKFVQKFFNVARFISMFGESECETENLRPADRWILSELSKTIRNAVKGYEDMEVFTATTEVRNFVWEKFAPHYIEMVKGRAYAGDKAAVFTLHTVLKAVLRLLAPVIPFVTDAVHREMYGRTVHAEGMPSPDVEDLCPGEKLMQFNEKVWAEKKQKNLSLKDSVDTAVPEELRPYEEELASMHNLSRKA